MAYTPLSPGAAAHLMRWVAQRMLDDERDLEVERERQLFGAPKVRLEGGKVKVEA